MVLLNGWAKYENWIENYFFLMIFNEIESNIFMISKIYLTCQGVTSFRSELKGKKFSIK